ncbi:MAG: lipoprotein insertase outer membrane protein LolB [Gammaproteobacteria bacterium]|nr:lipoprotein insertase outer membrane protein LolB [Gammaproteobacteria bacterium]
MISKTIKSLNRLVKHIALGMLCFGIAACSTTPTNTLSRTASHAYSPFSHKQSELEKLIEWDVGGKLAVHVNGKSNAGILTWRQRSAHFELLINGPLGSGQFHITGTPGLVIATNSTKQVEAASIEALFMQEFGWQFPMQELRYWVRGIPQPNTGSIVTYTPKGDAATIEQAGWMVTYHSYSQVSGLSMPKKVTIVGNDIRLVLVLKSWLNLFPFPQLDPDFSSTQNPQ